MKKLKELFERNRTWAAEIRDADPEFFVNLTHQQNPHYFWIGCSDSRVPANQIVGLPPGEMFVHRNVANIVSPTDLNALATLQFAVDVLKVAHVIVCGHYGCSGVRAALRGERLGLVDQWLYPIEVLYEKYRAQLEEMPESQRYDFLCEMNVREQVANVCGSKTVLRAWERGQALSVHGWIYSVSDGLLRDLDLCTSSAAEARLT